MSSRADFDQETLPPTQFQSRGIAEMYGFDSVNNVWRRMAVSTTGGISVTVDNTPGTVITCAPDTAVPAGPPVPLPVAPAGTRRMTIQNKSAGTTTEILVRNLGGVGGILLSRLGSTSFGGADGAIAPLEAVVSAGGPAIVGVTFEIT